MVFARAHLSIGHVELIEIIILVEIVGIIVADDSLRIGPTIGIAFIDCNSWSDHHVGGPAETVSAIINIVNLTTWILNNE